MHSMEDRYASLMRQLNTINKMIPKDYLPELPVEFRIRVIINEWKYIKGISDDLPTPA